MAIGDKPNSNLFGTDYNAGEEERKRLEAEAALAAQNARIGSGEAQAPVTFLPYADDVSTPRASALSVFTPGGEVKPNVDVNAITPSPETLPSPSSVNTALNKEVAVGSPSQEPGYFQRVGEFAKSALNRDQGLFDVDRLSTAADDLLGSAMRNLTPKDELGYTPEPFGKTLTDTLAITKPDGTKFYPDAVEPDATSTQGQQGTPNVDQVLQDGVGSFQPGGVDFSKPPTMPEAPKLEPELKIRQGEEGSPQKAFNDIISERPLTPEEIKSGKAFADRKGFDFNPQTGFSVIDNPGARVFDTPATLENFQARGLDVGQFMRYEDDPSQRTEQFVDDQGRLRRRLTRDAATLQGFSPERIDQDRPLAPKFAEAEATGDQMIADLRAKEAAKAERRNKPPRSALRYIAAANERGATRADKARGMEAATKYNLDLRTGQPLPEAPQAPEGLTFDQTMKLQDFNFKRDQESYKREQDDLVAQGKKTEAFEKDSALLRQVSGDAARIGRLTNEAIGITTESGTTALSGSLLKNLAGSDANQLKSILEVISSKVALDRLMEVKKTGATLGQVSEKELSMLQQSYDALQQSLPPERLRQALTNYANQLKKVEDQTQRAFINKHGQDNFNKIMGGGSMGQGEPRYANDQNVGDSAETYYNPSK